MSPSYLSNSSHFTDVGGTLPCTFQTVGGTLPCTLQTVGGTLPCTLQTFGGTLPCTIQTALSPILSQISPDQTLPFHFFKIYLNIIFPPTPKSFEWLFSSRFPAKGLHAFLFSPLRATCSFERHNIWEAEIMKLFPVSCCNSLIQPSALPERSSLQHS